MQLYPPDHKAWPALSSILDSRPFPATSKTNNNKIPSTYYPSHQNPHWGGQAFQRRELLVTVTETIPEKAPFEEEMLSTLPDQGALKATLYLLAHLISQQHCEGALNILTL